MKRIHRIFSLVLIMAIMLGITSPLLPSAASGNSLDSVLKQLATQVNAASVPEESYASTTQAPENHVPINIYLDNQPRTRQLDKEAESKKVLLVEDVLPWDSTANQVVLGSLTEYDKVTTQEFLDVELEQYSVIVFANDQPFNTYENYAAFKEYIEIFASIGGVIVFGACDAGWSNGQLIEALPGDVTKTNSYEYRNYIVDYDHPIVTGELTDGIPLVDDELYSNYCSHVSFDEDSLPAGTRIILRDTTSHRPTLIEYPLGKGRVIASGLTWEHNYIYGSDRGYRDFADIAMDDMFRYAIRISSIDVDELHFLTQWRLEKNAHTIIAADSSNGLNELLPIEGATVTVDKNEYITDENGAVSSLDFGVRTVQVTADGYRTRKLVYSLGKRQSRIFMMETDKNDGLPYVIQASGSTGEKDVYLDLRDQTCRFTQDAQRPLIMYFEGFWDSHGEGSFMVYQEGTKNDPGVFLTIPNGNYCNIMPGKVFKPNRQIKLKMVAADGTESEPINLNIYIDKKVEIATNNSNAALQEGMTTIDWIGNHPVQSDNDIFTKLFTTDMSIKSDLSPVEIAIEHNPDGTVTYKAVIGLVSGSRVKNILNREDDETDPDKNGWKIPAKESWEEWKKQIQGYKKAGNPSAYIKSLKEQYADDWKPTKMKVGLEFECKVAGYFEIALDQEGKIVHSEGGLIVEGSGSAVIGQTFFAGPVPLYYEFKPGVEIKLSGGIEFYNEDGWLFRPTFNGAELALPSISLEGGLGVQGVVTGGLKGSGKLVFGFGGDHATSGKIELGGSVHIKVLFVVDFEWPFWNTTIPLWPKDKAKNMAFGYTDDTKMVATMASRSYLNNRSNWNGAVKQLDVSRSASVPLQTLQYGVMPDAMPVIHQVGDKIVMLMLQDESYYGAGNHTRLVYSVLEDGYWTSPVPVMESDSADMYFDSKVINGQLYVAWQKIKTQVYGDDPYALLDEVTKNSEICVATWNDQYNSFENHQYLTNDETLDMMPSIAGSADGVYVSWVNNDANDALGKSGTYTLYQAPFQMEEDTKATVLEQTDAYVVEFVTESIGGKIHYAYTEMDGQNHLILNYFNGSKAKQLQTSADPMSLSFENGSLLWQENGAIRALNTNDGKTSELVHQYASASYQYLTNGTDQAIVWLDGDETGTRVMASMYCNEQWCAPITLVSGIEEAVTFYDALLQDDGSFSLILNTATTDEYGYENTALYYAEVTPRTDLAVQLAQTEYPDWEENTQQVQLYLENLGATTITEANLVVYSDGNTVLEQALEVELLPGEMKKYTVDLDIASLPQSKNTAIEVYVENDADLVNNRQDVALAPVNVALEYDVYEQNDELMFIFTISNAAAIDANVALQVFEDSLDGLVMDVKNVGVVTSNDCVQYVYVVNKEKIDFGDGYRKTYFFRLEMLENDWNDNDNICFYTVSKSPDEQTNAGASMTEYKVVNPQKVTIVNGDIHFESLDAPSVQLEAKITPENASVTYVRWEVENPDIVHVTSTGVVTPLRGGSTTITAYVTDDVKHTITVTVRDSNALDTSKLEKAIAQAEGIDSNEYSKDSYAALKDALANARKVLEDVNSTQEDVDQATLALTNAINALKPKTDILPLLIFGGLGLILLLTLILTIVVATHKKKKPKKEKE